MKQVFALWAARNREYYRDKASLFWSFIFTPLLVVILALSFSGDDTEVFTIGLLGDGTYPGAERNYIAAINYSDRERALKQIQYQQIAILFDPANQTYWLNEQSAKSQLLEELLASELNSWQQQTTSGRQVRYIDWVLPGMLAMNIMFSGLFGVGYVIVRYRKNGVLKRLQAAPVKAWQFLLAQGMSRLSIMLVVTTILFLACWWLVDLLVVGSPWLLLLIALLGNLSIISLALLFASRSASEEFTNGLLNAVSFPMLLLSEVWFSLDRAPQWLQWLAEISPLTHMVRAARTVMLEGGDISQIMPSVLVLTAMSLVFLTAAGWLFRWHQE
ncbi:ABC transporter permease [Porticoccus sp. W117]|uniref:ABC transporter permease n=1 Tax=Porticoccus sp. W117 TaxID=3054777 RepID=UPI00259467B8|nr:ABC transporter permease [Porticoccus sp. W117]MDM3871060.1 ABC transporter permease [Porticoccus sp. W117]